MSAYDNVVIGKLKLKVKALDVKSGGIKKKKKHRKDYHHQSSQSDSGRNTLLTTDSHEEDVNATGKNGRGGRGTSYDDHLTPAERRFLQQTKKLELKRLAKIASKSHRDRIQEFNQYLANLSEHYDIPKVGPG